MDVAVIRHMLDRATALAGALDALKGRWVTILGRRVYINKAGSKLEGSAAVAAYQQEQDAERAGKPAAEAKPKPKPKAASSGAGAEKKPAAVAEKKPSAAPEKKPAAAPAAGADKPVSPEKLTAAQESAVQTYTTSRYETINSGLRSGKLSAADAKVVAQLDSAMSPTTSAQTLYEQQKLYRAADVPEISQALASGKPLAGVTFTDKAFASTTKDRDAARNFQRSESSRLFVINAPKGTRALDVAKLSAYETEAEVLLARNTTFKVARVESVKEKRQFRGLGGKVTTRTVTQEYIHLDVVSQGSAKSLELDVLLWLAQSVDDSLAGMS